MTLDLYGHADEDFGENVRFFLPNLPLAQARLGHRPTIHLLAANGARTMDVEGVAVRFHRCVQPPRAVGPRARFARQLSPSLIRAISAESSDLVHFQGVLSQQAMYAAVAWRARRQGIPVVAQDQGPRPVGRWMSRAHAYAVRRSKALLAGSEHSAAVLTGLGAAPETVHLVSNGIDPEVFHPAPDWQSRPGPFRVLVVARLTPDKDPLTMADGVAGLAQLGYEVEATILSRGPLREQVERRLQGAGVATTFIDFVSQSELGDYYRWADALVLTSLQEGSSQVVLEAMACGVPVVATDIPGVRESVGDAGILVPTRDPEAVTAALRRLSDEPETGLGYRRRALERSRSFTWDAVARQVDTIYGEIVPQVS